MAGDAAKLFVEVQADVAGATKGLQQLDGQIKGMGGSVGASVSKTEQLNGALAKAQPAGAALAGFGGAVVGAFALAGKTAADFEAQMSAVKSVMSPADAKQFGGALEQLALTLGKDTSFSASEAAAGIEELVKAGMPLETIMKGGARGALDLAAATGISVPDAATIASNAMNTFRIPADKATHAMDVLAGTANASAADMTDLKFGMASVGAVAATVGLSFEDTSAAIGLFANNGLRGSDAGTSLKTMLLNLQPQTKAQKALFRELGLTTKDGANQFFDASGKIKSLAEVSGVLQNALKGMTEQQKLAALETMFGTDAIRAAAILAREGSSGFNQLAGEIAKVTVAQMATERLDNLNGSVKQLMGSIETAAITVAQKFLPVLRPLVDGATALVNGFLALPTPVQGAIVGFVAVAGVLALLLGGFVLLAPFLAALPAAFAAIGVVAAVVGGAIGGILLPVLAIGAAVALLYVAWTNNWLGIQDVVAGVWAFLAPVFQGIYGAIHDLVATGDLGLLADNLREAFGVDITPFLTAMAAVQTFVATVVLPALGGLAAFLGGVLAAAVQGASDLWTGVLLPALEAVGAFLSGTLFPFFDALANVYLAVVKVETAALAGLWQNVLLPAFTAVWTFLAATLSPAIDFLANTVLVGLAGVVTGLVGPALEWLNNSVVQPLIGGFNAISGAIQGATGWLNGLAASINSLALPAWLTPGSPTPFETGLWGINSALQAVGRTGMPSFAAEGGLPGSSFAGLGAGGGSGSVVNVNVTVGEGAVRVTGGDAPTGNLVGDAIAGALNVLAQRGALTSAPAATALPGAV